MKLARWTVLSLVLAAVATAALVHADAVTLQTTEMGRGATVVLVHGLGGSRMDWMPTVRKLLGRHRVVMVDLPGHGSSPLPDPFSLQAAAEALDAVVAKQKAESTIVVGQGLGGLLALIAASAHPDHQRGIMLIDALVKSPIPVPDQQREQLMKFADDNYAQFSQMLFSRMGRDSTESARLYAVMSALPAATVKAYFRQLLSVDASHDAKALKVPLSLVFTERTWKPGVTWGTLSKGFGYEDSTFTVPRRIANAGVFVMKDQPDTLAAIIADFTVQALARK